MTGALFFFTEVKGMEFLFSAGNNKANNVDFIGKGRGKLQVTGKYL